MTEYDRNWYRPGANYNLPKPTLGDHSSDQTINSINMPFQTIIDEHNMECSQKNDNRNLPELQAITEDSRYEKNTWRNDTHLSNSI